MFDPEETTLQAFERALLEKAPDGAYRLRLYVSGSSPRSAKAIANIRAICDQHLAGRYELDVVDLYQQPHLAKDAQIIAAPTLVKEEPMPLRKIVGDMSDEGRVLVGLDIQKL
jgi:circadian clock protein KaiB